MDLKASVQHQFGDVAAAYATSSVHAGGPDLAALVAAAALRGNERVLDAGCGTGHTALALAPGCAEVIGIDLTDGMLAQARALAQTRGITNARFEHGDVEHLPYETASFDLVVSRYCAHHFPQPAAAVAEIARVLKPGGAFLLLDIIAPEEPLLDTFLNAIEIIRDPSHVRDHSITQWTAMLHNAGFGVELLNTWPLRLEFESWTQRMRTPPVAVAQLQAMLAGAQREVREAFSISNDAFEIPSALIRAILAA